MFLARVEGRVVATVKHPTLTGGRFLLARRIETDGMLADEPNVVVDWHGATTGSTVIVSTDGDIARARFGNATPARMVVAGIVDPVQAPHAQELEIA
jgi:ethanolamine utilization protein EutN